MINVREQLKAYLDGELSPQQMRQIDQELERDGTLRREFDEMRRISSTLREASLPAAVVGLEQTLKALQAKPMPVKRPWVRWAPAVALVGTCAVAAVVVFRTPTTFLGNMAEEGPIAAIKEEAPVPKAKREIATAGVPAGGEFDSAAPAQSYAKGRSLNQYSLPNPMVPASVGQDRFIVRTANLSLKVSNASRAKEDAEQVAKSFGGSVQSSSLDRAEQAGKHVTLVLRIPVAKLDLGLAKLRSLGSVVSESTQGDDVTAQVVDTEARLKVMREEEKSYLKILGTAKRVSEVMSVKERLGEVRQEVESMEAQSKALRGQAAMATVNVELSQEPIAKAIQNAQNDWLDKTLITATSSLRLTGQKLVEAGIYLLVFAPLWIPLVLLAKWLALRQRLAA